MAWRSWVPWTLVVIAAVIGLVASLNVWVKRQALSKALKRSAVRLDDYVLKFRGAAVTDESTTLSALGAVPNAPFIVLPARRRPVR